MSALQSARWFSWCRCLGALAVICALCGCPAGDPLALDTELAIANMSRDWYLLVELEIPGYPAQHLPVLPPSAAARIPFRDLFGTACPLEMVVRAYVLEGDDTSVDAAGASPRLPALASAEVTVQACTGTPADYPVYNITLRDSPRGRGTILFAQDTPRQLRLDFWGQNIPGVNGLPPLTEDRLIGGYVLDLTGAGVPDVGVMLRPLYRDAGEPCPSNSGATVQLLPCGIVTPDPEVGLPIDATITDQEGRFTFSRPPGVYALEVFGDGFVFRPCREAPVEACQIFVEAPLDNVVFVAEPDTAEAARSAARLSQRKNP